jgi:hypothetical protein
VHLGQFLPAAGYESLCVRLHAGGFLRYRQGDRDASEWPSSFLSPLPDMDGGVAVPAALMLKSAH